MIVLIAYYQFIKPFLNNKMYIFEEYGAFNYRTKQILWQQPERICSKLNEVIR